MRRSYLFFWFALLGGLFGLQCFDSLSDDCSQTLECPDSPRPELRSDCRWYFPDGGLWEGSPRLRNGRWVWPDGRETESQTFTCSPDGGLSPNPPCGAGGECDAPLFCNTATNECVSCLDNSQCTSAAPVCDTTTGRCIECRAASDCTAPAAQCKTDPVDSRENRCVECLETRHCAGGEVCDTDTNQCTVQCNGSASDQCPADKPACDTQAGICVQCVSNQQCSGATPQCDTARNVCVACTQDTHCSTGQVCDEGSCVACRDDDHCGGTTAYCDTPTNSCVACLDDTHCTARNNSRCVSNGHTCAPCTRDAQCEEDAPFCREGLCVECRENGDCGEGGLCDVASGQCGECNSDADCTTADRARCDIATHTCTGCTEGAQCAGKPGIGALCREADGVCVDCTNNAECSADPARSLCSPAGECIPCTADVDCAAVSNNRNVCIGNSPNSRCVECGANDDCDNAARPVCALPPGVSAQVANTCVECVVDTDCRDPAASNCVNNTCQPCDADAQCGHIRTQDGLTALGVCDLTDRRCVQCTGADFEACAVGGAPRVCNSLTRTCSTAAPRSADACDACVSDVQCQTDQLCVEQFFDGTTSTGYYCFPRPSSNVCPVPFAAVLNASESIDRQTETICGLRVTTCPARADFLARTACSEDSECGVAGLNDGRCVTASTGVRCAIPCAGNSDNCEAGSQCTDGVCD